MMYECEKKVCYVGNGIYAVDIGNGKVLFLKERKPQPEKNKVPPKNGRTHERMSNDFCQWLKTGKSEDLIDEKDLIKIFVASGKDGVVSYKMNGKIHLLLMLGGSFYHYVVNENNANPKIFTKPTRKVWNISGKFFPENP